MRLGLMAATTVVVLVGCSSDGLALPEAASSTSNSAIGEAFGQTSTSAAVSLQTSTTQAPSTTTATDTAVSSDWVTITDDESRGALTFEGQMQLNRGQFGPVSVWLVLQEDDEPAGPRALIGHAQVDEDGMATFDGQIPSELGIEGDWREGQSFTFQPLVSGQYRVIVAHSLYQAGRGVLVDIDASRLQAIPSPTRQPPNGDGELLRFGVGGATFGDSVDIALVHFLNRFGEPTMDSGWYTGCLSDVPALRVVWWQLGQTYDEPVFRAEFNGTVRDGFKTAGIELEPDWVEDKTFVSYQFEDTPLESDTPFTGELLSTPDGLRPGMAVSELREIYGGVEFHRIGDTAIPNTWSSDPYHGQVSSDPTDSSAVVLSITAGRNLTGIPC